MAPEVAPSAPTPEDVTSALRTSAQDHAGTYEVAICAGTCADRVSVRGTLVLENDQYALAEVPEPAQSYFRRRTFILSVVRAREMPNACFVLERAPDAATYAGISRVGLTRWERDAATDSVSLPVFNSPDAGYVIRFVRTNGGFTGRGRSSGVGDWHVPLLDDVIEARRIGPPDRSICIREAAARAGQQ
jgi:hypothetical protein